MLIHGAWLTSGSWENFSESFRDRGFAVSAPEWPRKHGDVEELREATDEIERLGLTEIVDHYEARIQALDEPQRERLAPTPSFGSRRVRSRGLRGRRARRRWRTEMAPDTTR